MPRNMRKNVILPGKTGQQEAGALCIWVCMCVCVCSTNFISGQPEGQGYLDNLWMEVQC